MSPTYCKGHDALVEKVDKINTRTIIQTVLLGVLVLQNMDRLGWILNFVKIFSSTAIASVCGGK